MMQPLWKRPWQFPKMLNLGLLYDPAIPLLGMYLREMKAYTQTKKTYALMFKQHYSLIVKRQIARDIT